MNVKFISSLCRKITNVLSKRLAFIFKHFEKPKQCKINNIQGTLNYEKAYYTQEIISIVVGSRILNITISLKNTNVLNLLHRKDTGKMHSFPHSANKLSSIRNIDFYITRLYISKLEYIPCIMSYLAIVHPLAFKIKHVSVLTIIFSRAVIRTQIYISQ